MSPLLKIRSERDQMSAIERRIADFMLENAHLLRDYSSQQLADALRHQPVERGQVQPEARLQGLSGPEVLDRRGDRARRQRRRRGRRARPPQRDPHSDPGRAACGGASREAEEETRLINPPDAIDAIASAIGSGRQGVHHRPGRGRHPRARLRAEAVAARHPHRAPLRHRAHDRERVGGAARATCCWCSPSTASSRRCARSAASSASSAARWSR